MGRNMIIRLGENRHSSRGSWCNAGDTTVQQHNNAERVGFPPCNAGKLGAAHQGPTKNGGNDRIRATVPTRAAHCAGKKPRRATNWWTYNDSLDTQQQLWSDTCRATQHHNEHYEHRRNEVPPEEKLSSAEHSFNFLLKANNLLAEFLRVLP